MKKRPATNIQFTPYEISLCLYDTDRTKQWKQAIEDVVRDGDIVVDAGAGTGILGVFAALDHAKRVYSVELQPRFCKLIENLALKNGVSEKIVVINQDATMVELPEKVDIVICELLCTGQFFEPQVQIINHLRKYFKPGTKLIPRKIESFIQLLDAHEILYGVRIDTDSRSLLMPDDEPVSSKVQYDEIDLTKQAKTYVDSSVTIKARKTRVADAVVITSQATLSDDIITERTKFLYNPEVIYLKNPINLIKDKLYDIHISYPYGCDTLDAIIEVTESKMHPRV
ncbi:MAG: 50S ribosomal protein L11 methyltransferase [Bacteroidales bacterium]|nr:50S ribosomal protein L11 methyltransferase [Bacteroidales bacterium]